VAKHVLDFDIPATKLTAFFRNKDTDLITLYYQSTRETTM